MSSLPSVSAEAQSPDAGFSPSSDRADSITPEMSVADAFSLLATAPAEEAGRRVRKLDSKADPEMLHKLRVALRRLRSLWWAYEPLLDRKDAKFQRGEFKSLATAAGKTRDWDVLRDLLLAGESMQYSFTSLLGSVDEHRADALSFSRTAIGNAGVERILESALVGARYQLDSRATSPTLAEFAEDRVGSAEKALKKRLKRAVSHEDPGYAVLHEVRISGKRLRYLLEFFSPVLEGNHQATIERLTSVQDELGKLNDIVTSETLLREYSPQLGEHTVVKEAVRYLEDQKKRRMRAAQDMLNAAW
jgi:CHAD domain-containing protein